MAQSAKFFFFLFCLLGTTTTALLGNAQLFGFDEESDNHLSPSRSHHFDSSEGPDYIYAKAKIGQPLLLKLTNPQGTNYKWAYLGHVKHQEAAIIPSGESHLEANNSSQANRLGDFGLQSYMEKAVAKDDDQQKSDDDASDKSLRGSFPGAQEVRTVEVPGVNEAGHYNYFFAFATNDEDESQKLNIRLLHVHVK